MQLRAGRSSLQLSVVDRANEIARLLIAHGADPSIRTTHGKTAADLADQRALFEVAEVLRSDGIRLEPDLP